MTILSDEQILDRIMSGKPLSLIRAGDGEKIVLDGFKNLSAYNTVLKRQLGFSPPIEHAIAIRDNLIHAYERADIIGVPMQKNLESLNENWRGVITALDRDVPSKTDSVCSMDVFYHFLEQGVFDKIFEGRRVLNFISCRRLTSAFIRRWGFEQVNRFLIAPEAKFTSGYIGDAHYPDQFNKVHRWMTKCEVEGQICLVGAGFIGKIYCNWFRDLGGIALDVGAVMDLWAGRATRGPGRGLDVEDLTYKL